MLTVLHDLMKQSLFCCPISLSYPKKCKKLVKHFPIQKRSRLFIGYGVNFMHYVFVGYPFQLRIGPQSIWTKFDPR